MLSSREHNGVRSARKYALPYPSSPLARESTMVKKDSFSTSNHTHGLGGEAKEAMLRSGLRVKRTNSSLRIVATKGNAILTAAIHHIVHVPDLEVFRRSYIRKEDEFAESIPSAITPFQFVSKAQAADLPRWQRNKSSDDGIQLPTEQESQEMDKWLQEMRLKVHIRLVQKQQFTNTNNKTATATANQVIEHQSLPRDMDAECDKRTTSPRSPTSSRSSSRGESETDRRRRATDRPPKGELALDTLEPPLSAKRSPIKKLKERKEKRASLPPLPQKPQTDVDIVTPSKPRLPKIASHDSNSIVGAEGPLFYQRADIKARRTYSEQDVRRLRTKARNSVGLEPIT